MASKKKRSKKAAKWKAEVAVALPADLFAHAMKPLLELKRGSFKQAPAQLGAEAAKLEPQLSAGFQAFFVALNKTPANVQAVFRKAVAKIFAAIQKRTPVDTGHARSGWKLEQVEATETSLRFRIVNSVGYVIYLEFGWSDQAPAGMVRVTLLEAEQRLRRAAEAA